MDVTVHVDYMTPSEDYNMILKNSVRTAISSTGENEWRQRKLEMMSTCEGSCNTECNS